jgi:ferredoxin-NADP reductase
MIQTVKHYRLKNIRLNHDVIHLTLQPRRPSDGLKFQAGQYASIGFKSANGRRSPMRCFSIVSSPTNTEELMFAIRLGGRFTQSVAELKVGTLFFVQGPFGDFVMSGRYDKRIVMLAGGIGITPFMSMIRTACRKQSFIPITLLYSYRSHHDIPFYEELELLSRQNPNLKVVTFVTDTAVAPNIPQILSGRMTEEHIAAVTGGNYAGSTYLISGPKGFNQNVVQMLEAHHVDDERLITESFTQSSKLVANSGFGLQKLTYAFSGALLVVGIISIAYLDLSRYVPHYIQAADKVQSSLTPQPASTSTATQPTTSNTDSDQSANNSNTSTGNNTDSQQSTSSGNSSTASSGGNTSTPQTYQTPVTSVS